MSVFVALGIQYAVRLRPALLSCLSYPAVPVFTHYLVNGTIFGIKLLNMKYVLIFYTNFVRNVSHH
jgi:hypothetical protein